jgi:hypothetical protein
MQRQPTLLSSCARAATAAEARYRISAPGFAARDSRIIGLDEQSALLVRDMSGKPWGGGRFLEFEAALPDDALLRDASGGTALLSEELDGADAVVMIATAAESAEAASIIGAASGPPVSCSPGMPRGKHQATASWPRCGPTPWCWWCSGSPMTSRRSCRRCASDVTGPEKAEGGR